MSECWVDGWLEGWLVGWVGRLGRIVSVAAAVVRWIVLPLWLGVGFPCGRDSVRELLRLPT